VIWPLLSLFKSEKIRREIVPLDQTLSVGLVNEPGIFTDLLREMLDHQGISYEEINGQLPPASSKYPVVLIANYSSESYELARKSCLLEENVVIATRILNLELVLKCLSGTEDTKKDRFDLLVNQEESKLRDGIKDSLERLNFPLVLKWFWPGKSEICCVFTHDVDWFSYSPFHKVVLHGRPRIFSILKMLFESSVLRKDYGWNIPEIIEIQKKYGTKSSFYFQTHYEKGSSLLTKSVKMLRSENFEIGLHASHSSHETIDALKNELNLFERNGCGFPAGIRFHILKFNVPKTWALESEAGMEYDATFCYNRFFGFRAETCLPFHPIAEARMSITELPTSFMDWTALYRKKRGEDAQNILEEIKTKVKKYNGVLAVNFHNTYINKETFPDIYNLHEELAKEARSNGWWTATSRECVEWWSHRAGVELKPRMSDSKTVTVIPTDVTSIVYPDEKKFVIDHY